ncbi:conserved hypothetical protein [Paecilomyces variotii No. 5]|uniref:DUF4211 domain-containing protein n=1 Tax=Byssochlamys spectabilis (strain No. 5 / NBRC 109023) TaxID=1356009 RepID=V5HYM2_BYSSN|nr:conserved hypothetical protein [Paecilomyces variotii No. 5]
MPRTSGKVKQTRLSFTPAARSASPGVERSPGSDRVAAIRYERPSKVTLSRGPLRIDDYPVFRGSDVAADTSSVNTPVKKKEGKKKKKEKKEKSREKRKRKKGSKSEVKGGTDQGQEIKNEEEESSLGQLQSRSYESDEVIQIPARKREQSGVNIFDDEDESESKSDTDRSATPVPTTRKSRRGQGSKEDTPKGKEPRSGKSAGHKKPDAETRTPLKRKYAATESADDSESPVMTGRSSRTRPSTQQSSEQDSSGASDEDVVTRPTPRRLKRGSAPTTALSVDDSDDSDDIILSSPAKRRRLDNGPEGLRTPRQTSDQDRLDLEEDLEDLKDSAVKKTRTRGRIADSARLTRQRQLELLRRRRAGEKATSVSESQQSDESDGEQSQPAEESEEDESDSDSESEDSEDSDIEAPVSENEDLDRYEEDFVLQDDEGELGAPTDLADMPFEFTRHSYKQPKEFFRDVVEWMVHNKLNPAFPRSDPVYQVAFMKLEDEVKGRAGSQLVSTVWNSDFRRALMARPQIEVTLFPITEGHPCDACNRSGHPASFDIKLYGKPYSLDTLEPLSDEEDSDEESESHDPRDKDKDGNPLPDEDRRFYLGRHCKSRASMAHTLVHWRFHLNEWVIDYLEKRGVFTDEKVVERSHWSVKRQTKYANGLVDSMVETGEVKRLWRDFHINLKAARETTTESRW